LKHGNSSSINELGGYARLDTSRVEETRKKISSWNNHRLHDYSGNSGLQSALVCLVTATIVRVSDIVLLIKTQLQRRESKERANETQVRALVMRGEYI